MGGGDVFKVIALTVSMCCNAFVPSVRRINARTTIAAAKTEAEALAFFKDVYGNVKPGTLYARSDSELRATYSALVSVYGEDTALEMTKRNPSALAYNKAYFAPSLKAFAAKFGDQEARAMVLRNPNLLAVPPTGSNGAETVKDDAMFFSYVSIKKLFGL